MKVCESAPVLGFDEFPSSLYVLKHTPTGRYGCYCHDGVNGLACFTSTDRALEFGSYIEVEGMEVVETSFDGARQIAKDRPLPVVAVMLLDDRSRPVVHFVR